MRFLVIPGTLMTWMPSQHRHPVLLCTNNVGRIENHPYPGQWHQVWGPSLHINLKFTVLTWDLCIYCHIRTQTQFRGWTGWRTPVKDFCIKEQKWSKTPIRNWVAIFTGILSWHVLWNCVIKTRTENYMFHHPELEWVWTGLCTKESVTERLFKITKNKPRLSSDDISTNILHCLEWKIICIIYTKLHELTNIQNSALISIQSV